MMESSTALRARLSRSHLRLSFLIELGTRLARIALDSIVHGGGTAQPVPKPTRRQPIDTPGEPETGLDLWWAIILELLQR